MSEPSLVCRICGVREAPQHALEPAFHSDRYGVDVWAYECVKKKACASRMVALDNERKNVWKRKR